MISVATSFSAGIMVYISLNELLLRNPENLNPQDDPVKVPAHSRTMRLENPRDMQ